MKKFPKITPAKVLSFIYNRSALRSLHDGYRQWRLNQKIDFRGQQASDYIRDRLNSPRPLMACRLGTGELYTMIHYHNILRGKEIFEPRDYDGFEKIAGFFPVREDLISRYYFRMVEDLKEVDVLASWIPAEATFAKELATATRIPLSDLEPYYHQDPWTAALEGKTVLVVHPFVKTIQQQYHAKEFLFRDSRVLPNFELKTIQSVQSIGSIHGRRQFSDWFEALESMENAISETDFDVALIGCGAYGLPLAAHVKRLGKKSVHLGGATQILFGIRGKRWEDIPKVLALFNPHWVRPSEEDRPDNYKEIEGGSYW